jgi:hypothetical protein
MDASGQPCRLHRRRLKYPFGTTRQLPDAHDRAIKFSSMDDWFSRPPGNEARPTRGSARPSLHEITDHLLIGEYPRAGDIEWLNKVYGVTAILNLQDDEDLRINALDIAELRDLCSRLGMKLVRSPIHDGSADDMGERSTPANASTCTATPGSIGRLPWRLPTCAHAAACRSTRRWPTSSNVAPAAPL